MVNSLLLKFYCKLRKMFLSSGRRCTNQLHELDNLFILFTIMLIYAKSSHKNVLKRDKATSINKTAPIRAIMNL